MSDSRGLSVVCWWLAGSGRETLDPCCPVSLPSGIGPHPVEGLTPCRHAAQPLPLRGDSPGSAALRAPSGRETLAPAAPSSALPVGRAPKGENTPMHGTPRRRNPLIEKGVRPRLSVGCRRDRPKTHDSPAPAPLAPASRRRTPCQASSRGVATGLECTRQCTRAPQSQYPCGVAPVFISAGPLWAPRRRPCRHPRPPGWPRRAPPAS